MIDVFSYSQYSFLSCFFFAGENFLTCYL